MSKEQMTFFGGLETTGGVQLLYGKGESAVMFDFGIAHKEVIDVTHVFTRNPVRPTPGRELRQLILGKLTPPLLELYDPAHVRSIHRDETMK